MIITWKEHVDKCKIVFHKRKHVLSPPAIQYIRMLVFEFNFLSEFVLHACIRMLSPKIMIGKSCAESSLTFGPKNLLRGNNSSFLRAEHQYSSCWPSSVSDPSSSFNHYVGTAPHSNDSYHPSCCIKFVPYFLSLTAAMSRTSLCSPKLCEWACEHLIVGTLGHLSCLGPGWALGSPHLFKSIQAFSIHTFLEN